MYRVTVYVPGNRQSDRLVALLGGFLARVKPERWEGSLTEAQLRRLEEKLPEEAKVYKREERRW